MINATMTKFGYPHTLVAEYAHWVVLLRPQAVTLGALVLGAKSDATRYGDLPPEVFAEQGHIIAWIERALASFCGYEKINYLILMMVDPHVHFHVVPRYGGVRRFDEVDYPDAGWPRLPDLNSAPALDAATSARMIAALRRHRSEEPPVP